HPRHGCLHRSDDIQVRLARKARVNPALEANFRRTGGSGFGCAARYFVEVEIVGGPTQVGPTAALGEGAEATMVEADVGVVDVPVDDVGHGRAYRLLAELV